MKPSYSILPEDQGSAPREACPEPVEGVTRPTRNAPFCRPGDPAGRVLQRTPYTGCVRRWTPLVALLSIALPQGFAAGAGEPVNAFRLGHRFQVGSELVYDFTSTLHQETVVSGEQLGYEMKMAGVLCQTVADVDSRKETALIGQLGTSRWEAVTGRGEATGTTTKDQTWISAYRLGSNGRSITREMKEGDSRRYLVHRTMNQISENAQICAAFPSNDVTLESHWEGPVLLPMPGIRQPGRANSKITAVDRNGGTNLCTIRSEIFSAKGQSFATYRPDVERPDMEVAGSSEGLFDIDRGIWLRTQVDLTAKIEGPASKGVMHITGKTTIMSARLLPDADAAGRRERFTAFEAALSRLYDNESEKAVELLTEQRTRSGDADWKKGVNLTLALVEQVRREMTCEKGEEEGKLGPETKLMAEADRAAHEERWKEAVEKYEALAKDYPGHRFALQALTAAADIYERKLGRKSTADELRRRLVSMREKAPTKEQDEVEAALSIYKQAGAHETAGDLRRAAEGYERFLACRNEKIPVSTRILAQFRAGGLYDKLGDRKKAVEAYRAAIAMESDDEYSAKLKEKARERLRE